MRSTFPPHLAFTTITHCALHAPVPFLFSLRCGTQGKRATNPAQPKACSSQHSCASHNGCSLPKPRTGRGPKNSQPEGRNILRAERKIKLGKHPLITEKEVLKAKAEYREGRREGAGVCFTRGTVEATKVTQYHIHCIDLPTRTFTQHFAIEN